MPALHISSVTDIIIIHICMGMVCIATTTTTSSSEYVATHHGPSFYLFVHRMRLFVYAPSLHNINTVFLHHLVKSYINLSSSPFLFLLFPPPMDLQSTMAHLLLQDNITQSFVPLILQLSNCRIQPCKMFPRKFQHGISIIIHLKFKSTNL